MGTALCPECGSARVRRASGPWGHALRVLIGSNKRFCLECGEKWHIARELIRTSSYVSNIQIALLAGLCGLFFIAVINLLQDPSFNIKRLVRSYYDEKYGTQSKQRLWKNWGWLYGGRGKAQKEYHDHSPR